MDKLRHYQGGVADPTGLQEPFKTWLLGVELVDHFLNPLNQWFLVELGCLRLDYLKFVNRRSFRDDPLQAATRISPENGMTRWAKCDIERLMVLLGTPTLLHPHAVRFVVAILPAG